jgi:hypothetical protein
MLYGVNILYCRPSTLMHPAKLYPLTFFCVSEPGGFERAEEDRNIHTPLL